MKIFNNEELIGLINEVTTLNKYDKLPLVGPPWHSYAFIGAKNGKFILEYDGPQADEEYEELPLEIYNSVIHSIIVHIRPYIKLSYTCDTTLSCHI